MRPRWLVAAVVIAVAVGLFALGPEWSGLNPVGREFAYAQLSGRVVERPVTCNATTVTNLVPNTPTRKALIILNPTNITVYVGQGSHAALTTARGFTLHAGASLNLEDYPGGLDCVTDSGIQELRVLEVFR